jgi:hypothetical protein
LGGFTREAIVLALLIVGLFVFLQTGDIRWYMDTFGTAPAQSAEP